MTVTGEFCEKIYTYPKNQLKDPPKNIEGGLDCVFRRVLLDLQATSELRSHDSELVTPFYKPFRPEGVPQPDP